MIKFPLFIAYYLLISSAAWEKRRFFPKKSLPAILNFASYIPARRGEVSELVEGARLEIVCTQKVPGVRISPSPPEILNPLETVGFFFLAWALFLRIQFRDTFGAHHAICRGIFSLPVPFLPDDPSRYSLLSHSCSQPFAITDWSTRNQTFSEWSGQP